MEGFSGKIEKAREKFLGPRRIDLGNGIVFESRLGGKSPEIVLKKGNEILLDFSTLSPPGTKLVFSENMKWRAVPGKKPEIKIGRFKDAGAILSFLHESGHLQKPDDADISETARRAVIRETKNDKENAYPWPRLKALKEERTIFLRIERDAWAHALRKARELEGEYGIDIFGRLPGNKGNLENAKDFINKCLDTYEQVYLDELRDSDIFSKVEMEKLFEEIDERMAK